MPTSRALLDTRAVYVCPRINPDGAEWALADKPKYIRSSTRPYPFDEDAGRRPQRRGRRRRRPHPLDAHPRSQRRLQGHPDDPRLMSPRDPGESGGEYWRVIPEGTLLNYDGVEIRVNRDKRGPRPQPQLPVGLAAGVPAGGRRRPIRPREPEVRAVVDFIVAPSATSARRELPHAQRRDPAARSRREPDDEHDRPRTCGSTSSSARRAPSSPGYPNISIFHDFKYHPKQVITGGFDWIYEHLGAVLLDGGDLGAGERGRHQGLPLHRLVSRASARGRPEAPRVERPRAGRRGLRRLVPVRASAARAGGAGRLEQARTLPQSAGEVCSSAR